MNNVLTLETNKYAIKIDNFEGPLDLLCYLIDKNKMEISEVKISEIADQYLEFLSANEKMNLEIASEFLIFFDLIFQNLICCNQRIRNLFILDLFVAVIAAGVCVYAHCRFVFIKITVLLNLLNCLGDSVINFTVFKSAFVNFV